ncbi:WD40/YVTN/BNR-like repeat-containing protein [Piscinibacter terrae]|uniref:Exo-alpha-sialidase n=1 Tax=Piscinibacter terrae TaxID=2496871 RepID=A0A3N7K1N0_9BURK|nr:sialidase family protein [Albitalea terrae]RQP24865.1 exo-alpha-sialidase [Albitalea terrae]
MSDRAWVATRKGLFELRNDRAGWRIANVSFLGEPVSMVLPPTSSGRMLAALNLGHFGVKVHASDDGGKTWQEVATPTYPEQPADAKGPAWKMVQIWSMEARNGTVWAGTLPGGLFRSDDGGASWTLNDALWNRPERTEWFGGGYDVPGIHSICPHPARTGEILVGVSCGGAWITRDDGQSWSVHCDGMHAAYMPPEQAENPNTQDPHRIVRCASAPEVLWTQHHCGIWKTSDNAARWEEVKAPLSSFGFAVAVHPSRPGTAWFVPGVADQRRIPVEGQLVVNRTRDGGKTFETLREGLPQEACYDLTYRHGLDVAPDGDHLLMGSTTGSLWATGNGGDSWTTVSNHLPPIYAVRFG